jgi:hypothetical protein
MKLKFVTFTGADNQTNARDMLALSKQFPFVEWAILFSKTKQGVKRYPDFNWIENSLTILKDCNLSAHLCGQWVSEAISQGLTFLDTPVAPFFKRIQLNLGKSRLHKLLKNKDFWDRNLSETHQVIIGGNFPEDIQNVQNCTPLFDCSGGHGISPEKWQKPFLSLSGFAGGLNQNNIEEQLCKIAEVAKDQEIWVDMETGVRNQQDEFDLNICEDILKKAIKWL